jgi:hypothetical protein
MDMMAPMAMGPITTSSASELTMPKSCMNGYSGERQVGLYQRTPVSRSTRTARLSIP